MNRPVIVLLGLLAFILVPMPAPASARVPGAVPALAAQAQAQVRDQTRAQAESDRGAASEVDAAKKGCQGLDLRGATPE